MAKRILVVEDEENARRFYQEDLGDLGYEVVCVDNGMKAIQLTEQETFDLVITDIRMPEVGGIALVPYLDKFNAKVPVLVVTAYEQYRDLLMDEDPNVKGYYVKPVNAAVLGMKIKELLGE